jgi:hypothetical protein
VLEDGRIGLVLDVPSLIRDLVREPDGRGAAPDARPTTDPQIH